MATNRGWAVGIACAASFAMACTATIGNSDTAVSSDTSGSALCASRPEPIDHEAPLFLYYSLYLRRGDSAPTLALASGPGERVLAINRPDEQIFRGGDRCAGLSSELDAWRARGGKIAKVIDEHELARMLARGGAADAFISYFHAGVAYVAIDEIANVVTHTDGCGPGTGIPCHGWWNGGRLATGLASVLGELASRGYDRRVILYSNTYNLVGDLDRYSQILGACRDHCRVLASEIYMHTDRVMSPSTAHCHWNLECFERSAGGLERAAPGINGRTITVLGLSPAYNQPDDPRSLCDIPGGGHGALYRQYAKLHAGTLTSQQPGVGGYALADVPDGFAPRQAACLSGLNGWSGWPRARGGAAATDGPAVPGGGDAAPPTPMTSSYPYAWSAGGAVAPERTWRPMDVDGDGRDDLVHTWLWEGGLRLHTLFANGDGTWRPAAQDVWPGFGATDLDNFRPADLDGDGRRDLVHVWHSGAGLRVHSFSSNGDGTWRAAANDPWPGFGAHDTKNWRPMDADGDGRDDLVHVWRHAEGVRIHTLFSDGAGGFRIAGHDPWPGFGANDVQTFRPADLNGDGRMDLVHVWHSGAGLRVHSFLSNGDGTYAPAVSDPWPGFAAYDTNNWRVMDADADGRDDLVHVWHSGAGLRIHTLFSDGGGGFRIAGHDPWPGFGATDVTSFLPTDIDGDGRDDLVHVWWNGAGVRVHGLLSNGDGTFRPVAQDPWPGFGASDVLSWRPMDVDGDRRLDLVHTWPHEGVRVHTLFSDGGGGWRVAGHDPWPGFGAPF